LARVTNTDSIERAVAQVLAQLVEAQFAEFDAHLRPVAAEIDKGFGEACRTCNRRHANHEFAGALPL
jgi:isocitrate lyase